MARESIDDLKFSLDVSVRYHDRRRGFYDLLHRFVAALSVLGGSVAAVGLVSLLQEWPIYGEAMILVSVVAIAVFNSIDLVVGFAVMAREHDSLYRRYIELDADIVRVIEPSPAQLGDWAAEHLLIERDEPPTYWGVYAQCWNQSVHYLGRDKGDMLKTNSWRNLPPVNQMFRWHERYFPPVHSVTQRL